MTIRLLLVDDQPLLREGMAMVLGGQPDMQVVGEAGDGATAVAAATRLLPDVVLMDVRMPNVDGVEAARRIVQQGLPCRVLVLTTFDDDDAALAALRAGASGFLLKDVAPAELVTAIRTVARGDAVVAGGLTRRLLDTYADRLPHRWPDPGPAGPATGRSHPRIAVLTEREGDVFALIARGLSNQEIAGRLVLSEMTIKSHITKILRKLELRDRVQAVILAYDVGIAP